jgi:hypothetical protein
MGQSNMHFSNSIALDILNGDYDPNNYKQSIPISNPGSITQGINANVSPDYLHSY